MFGRDGGTRTHNDTVRSRAVFQLAYTSIKRLVNYAFSILRRPLHFLLLLYNPLFNKAIPTFNSFSHGHTPNEKPPEQEKCVRIGRVSLQASQQVNSCSTLASIVTTPPIFGFFVFLLLHPTIDFENLYNEEIWWK